MSVTAYSREQNAQSQTSRCWPRAPSARECIEFPRQSGCARRRNPTVKTCFWERNCVRKWVLTCACVHASTFTRTHWHIHTYASINRTFQPHQNCIRLAVSAQPREVDRDIQGRELDRGWAQSRQVYPSAHLRTCTRDQNLYAASGTHRRSPSDDRWARLDESPIPRFVSWESVGSLNCWGYSLINTLKLKKLRTGLGCELGVFRF